MKYCISGRQSYSVMEKADQIKVKYEDQDRIIDFVEKLPDKEIILELKSLPDKNVFKTWRMYDEKFANFYIALHDLNLYELLNAEGIKWYWPYPVTSYYELKEILKLCPSFIQLGPPLSFDLENVQKIVGEIKLRMICNFSRPKYLPKNNKDPQFFGQWVRPEDVHLYEPYIEIFEFEFEEDGLKKEETYLHIYKDNKYWPGNLNLLIEQLNFNVDNRSIPEEFGKARIKCCQRCLYGRSCRICYNALNFSELMRKERDYRKNKENN